MRHKELLEGLEPSDQSVFKSKDDSERKESIDNLMESTKEDLRENEIKEAESIENALNDYSINI